MPDAELTERQLLAAIPSRDRPTPRTLRRLRDAGLIARPTRRGRGRGQGVDVRYPRSEIARLHRIAELRRAGVRALRDLRWQVWWDGDDQLWPRVRADLVDAYDRDGEQRVLNLCAAASTSEEAFEELQDAAADAQRELAAGWRANHYPSYARRRMRRDSDVESLAAVAIGRALPELEEAEFALPTDGIHDDDSDARPETYAGLTDRAWGPGAADTLQQLEARGAFRFEGWLTALERSTAAEARAVASLWAGAFDARTLKREFQFFGKQWPDRAMLMAASLFAMKSAVQP